MKDFAKSRRGFLKTTGVMAGGFLALPERHSCSDEGANSAQSTSGFAKRVRCRRLHIRADETSPVEIAPKRIISITTYNGQFPGPLLDSRKVSKSRWTFSTTPIAGAVALAWSEDPDHVDGAAEERTPFIPAHDKRRSCLHAQAGWLAVLSRSQPRRRKSRGWTI